MVKVTCNITTAHLQPRSPARRTGITLADVVIATLILGILAASAGPRYLSALQRFRLEAAARRIAADLELARRHARQTGEPQAVKFDAAADTYSLVDYPDPARPKQNYSVDLATTSYPAQLMDVSVDGADTVIFDRYGRPWPPAGVPLVDAYIDVEVAARIQRIRLNPLSGKADLE